MLRMSDLLKSDELAERDHVQYSVKPKGIIFIVVGLVLLMLIILFNPHLLLLFGQIEY